MISREISRYLALSAVGGTASELLPVASKPRKVSSVPFYHAIRVSSLCFEIAVHRRYSAVSKAQDARISPTASIVN